MIKYLIVYLIIAVVHFACEYASIKRNINVRKRYSNKPRLDYCFYRAICFPITWIRSAWYFTKPE